MGKASIVRPLAALTGLIGAGVGVVALVDWQRAGWDRAAFSLDYGGPVAPLAAFLFVALGVSGVALSIAGRGRLVRQGVGAVSILALGLMLAVTIRGNFRSPDFVEWKSGGRRRRLPHHKVGRVALVGRNVDPSAGDKLVAIVA